VPSKSEMKAEVSSLDDYYEMVDASASPCYSINDEEKVRHVGVPFVTATNDDACFVSVHQEQELEPSQAVPKTKRPPRPRVSNGGAPLRRSARLAAKNPRRSPRLAAKRLAAKP